MRSRLIRLHSHTYKIWLLSLVQKHGTLAAAALEAKISASAVSQAVSQLEGVLEKVLLDRSGKEVKLSPSARALIQLFEPTLNLLENFEPSALSAADLPKRIRLGAYESLAIDFFPQFVPSFRSQWPEIDLEIETGRSRYLIERCRNQELDLAFVVDATHGSNIYAKAFAEDQFGIFARKDIALGKKAEAVIEKFGLAVMKIDDKHHSKTFIRFISQLPQGSRPTLVTESFEVILSLVNSGAMAGTLPYRVAKRAAEEIVLLDLLQSKARTGVHSAKKSLESEKKLAGAHELFLVCHPSFSMRMFETVFHLSRAHCSLESRSVQSSSQV